MSDPDPKGDTPFSEKAPPPVYGPPAPAETIISQTVWMYGYGGQWDRLTEKNGYLRFAWNTDKAWTKERQGWCNTPGAWNGWELDGCWMRDYNDAGFWVWRSGRGDWHWDPFYWPPTYFHSLFDDEVGNAVGEFYCLLGSQGSIVNGIASTCSVSVFVPL